LLNITEIRVKLVHGTRDKLCAFASITIENAIVIRDIKIISGGERLFVAMPSRKLCDRCPRCGGKNYVRSRYCSDCGTRLGKERAQSDDRNRPRLYSDIAHPIHQKARTQFQEAILTAYQEELEASRKEDYVATEFADMDYQAWSEE
jgi:stage V sporulation protein G